MLEQILLPDSNQFHVENWSFEDQATLSITICSRKTGAHCPACGYFSAQVHSHYQRTLADLPSAGYAVRLDWTVRRFFCQDPDCPKVTFTEQLPQVAQRYVRKTNRLQELFRQAAFAFGGEADKRALALFHLATSSDTLLNLVKNTPKTAPPEVRVLGVDDWAWRKGQRYGTLLVDLERHCPIDLLPDREPQSLIHWLEEHPGVGIITRDRGKQYIEGSTQGAPAAIQVADRFHILVNLQEALKRLFERHPGELHQAKQRYAEIVTEEQPTGTQLPDIPSPAKSPPSQPEPTPHASHRLKQFQTVNAFQAQGRSQREIARQVRIDRRTMGKYFALEQPPQKVIRPQNQSSLRPSLSYLRKRWQEGGHNRAQLLAEVRGQGYRGGYASLWRATARFPVDPKNPSPVSHSNYPWSPSQAAWLLMTDEDRLSEKNKKARTALLAVSQKADSAIPLIRSFQSMVRERKADRLEYWLQQAESSDLVEFRRFAVGLRQDYQAILSGLSLDWSNAQTEGQVNRLKLVKREMYGRASFGLLKRRFLGYG